MILPVKKLKNLILLLIVAALVWGGYLLLRDLSAPQLTLAPTQGALSARKPVTVTVTDTGTGDRKSVV